MKSHSLSAICYDLNIALVEKCSINTKSSAKSSLLSLDGCPSIVSCSTKPERTLNKKEYLEIGRKFSAPEK